MLEGMFVTVTRFKSCQGKSPFPIGARLLCRKDPNNIYDTEAIRVFARGGIAVGYIANSASTKANGTMSAARIYDYVGRQFLIEVCFSTQTKVICQVLQKDLQDPALLEAFLRPEPEEEQTLAGLFPEDVR